MNLELVSKRDLMKLVWSDPDEYRKLDSATPCDTWKEKNPSEHVMSYNYPHTYGKILNIEEEAKKRGIKLYHEIKIAQKHFETIKEAFEILEDPDRYQGDKNYAIEILKEAFNYEEFRWRPLKEIANGSE